MRWIAVLCLLVISAGTFFFLQSEPYAEAASIAVDVGSFEELEDRFEELAREKGGAYAFEVLRRAPLPENTDLHLLGHAVGDILYTEEGVSGIALCTQDFRNACSHSIVVGALNEFGEAALPKIREACHKAPGGPGAYTMCYHGLGHGVFAYYGYDLAPTIALCEKTGTSEYQNREAIECIGGAIMELTGGGGHDREAWEKARKKYLTSPLAPCRSSVMPPAARAQCLMYLTPEIWKHAGIDMGQPDPALFAKAFSYCEAIPRGETSERESCFGGFGKEFVPIAGGRDIRRVDALSDEQYVRAASWCHAAASGDGVAACIGSAVDSIFWGGENDPDAAFRFCALSREPRCYHSLAKNISRYTMGEKRDALCGRLARLSDARCL